MCVWVGMCVQATFVASDPDSDYFQEEWDNHQQQQRHEQILQMTIRGQWFLIDPPTVCEDLKPVAIRANVLCSSSRPYI